MGVLEKLMPQFLKDNETQAKVLGKLDAYKVLARLQQNAVAENYAILNDENAPDGQTRHSLIGYEIMGAISQANRVSK